MKEPGNSRAYMRYLSLGMEIAGSLALPIGIGYWLDIRWNTTPWLLLTGALCGIIILFGLMVRLARSEKG